MADYYFNFPPIINLTAQQQNALNEKEAIALSGGPGTGKSFVSLWRHISNFSRQNIINSQLLTFTKSLTYYLKASSATANSEAAKNVASIKKWYYTTPDIKKHRAEIIVDEAQDMPLSFYEELKEFTPKISYGADDKQILQSECKNIDGNYNLLICSPESDLANLLHNRPYELDVNFRNTKSILQFAQNTFDEAIIPPREINSCRQVGDKPSLFIHNGNLQVQIDTIKKLLSEYSSETHNIGILTPLAIKPWPGGDQLTAFYYYNLLKDDFDCSYYDHQSDEIEKMKNIHITPFKSCKGLEFDTVIIPCFNYYNFNFRKISWRDFFVAVTRAKNNLFLFSDQDLPQLHSVVEVDNLRVNRVLPMVEFNRNQPSIFDTDDLPF